MAKVAILKNNQMYMCMMDMAIAMPMLRDARNAHAHPSFSKTMAE